MSATPPPPAPIASRPRYARLQTRRCGAALMVADKSGAAALLALADDAPELMSKASVVLCDAAEHAPALQARGAARLLQTSSTAGLSPAIATLLGDARMGLQVFLAGAEGLIAQVQSQLLSAGVPLGAIQAEHRGTAARRMQCVHCKTVAEDVTVDPYICPGCGRSLYVRDHFSRRVGAFQGVCIDAETPGEVPESVEIRI
ncbi:dimethylamine monooxygenase subunit DmmA family protein [Paracoccus sp. CPCC 101403]|uniref:Dimethylamine monooxygenase subunit DmmA family protein n=2 Tax=Paracoccus broussonetiae TaxID=3075834 RepID=A0ABU3EDY4_9RHOB|nr:dimethylamine monooxygenase subunit DmmA family protein [Paracoccus sp. CPCC 101403]MDT1062445.1 dimethylamine monooxygenase subunit DmmA family protein [Paracoccus sp. CPCC 101403]